MERYWFDLQRFAGEGAGDGGGEGAATVESPADDGQKLLELGVPADKVERHLKRAKNKGNVGRTPDRAVTMEQPKQENAASQQVAAAENTEAETDTDSTPVKPSWEDIMADPEYNKEMQKVIAARLKKSGDASEKLTQLEPMLEVLARRYKLDPSNLDYEALSKAVNDDTIYYEEKALELGIPVEQAMERDQRERSDERERRREEMDLQRQAALNHIKGLEQQGKALQQKFPKFDLRAELQNPAFARMTAPGVGLSVEDAYWAVHRSEIMAAEREAAAKQAAEKLSKSIQSGSRRPDEGGAASQTASAPIVDYSKLSREEREGIKARVYRGEKIRF